MRAQSTGTRRRLGTARGAGGGRGGAVRSSSGRSRGLWQGRRASPTSAIQLALMRLGNGWRLLLAVGMGILVAVVLICSVPLYGAFMTDVALQLAIRGIGGTGRTIDIAATSERISATYRAQSDDAVRQLGNTYLSSLASPEANAYLVSGVVQVVGVNGRAIDPKGQSDPRVAFLAANYAQAAAHIQLSDGALPRSYSGGTTSPDAVITARMAQALGLHVGDTLRTTYFEFGSEDPQSTFRVAVHVAGIWEPATGAGDPYWNGQAFYTPPDHSGGPAVYSVLMDPDAFVAAIAPMPDLGITQHWVYFADPSRINSGNMSAVVDDIALLRSHAAGTLTPLGASAVTVTAGLEAPIEGVTQQIGILSLPLYVIVAQIVGLAMLFVVAMAGLLVDGHAGEIATLKSRGASGTQMLSTYAVQGILLGIAAAVAGPWLAGLLALGLLRWFVPASTLAAAGVGSSYLTALAAPSTIVLPAVGGALLGAAAVVGAAQRAARLDVLAFRREQARATREPFWRRYYLDIGLAVLCALGYLELAQFGGLGTREALGQGASSPLPLAAPALLLLAGALLVLRFFPVVTGAGARLASRGRGTTGMLALAEVSRSPAGPSRLTLLLALSVGLGLFAMVFDSSLVRNSADRAAYQTGADIRLVQRQPEPAENDARIQAALSGLAGVHAVTPVFRGVATSTLASGVQSVNLLGIDPATWRAAAGASWRSDYADQPIARLLDGLRTQQDGDTTADREGATNAGDAAHPVWAIVSANFASGQALQVGDRFQLVFQATQSTPTFFRVGAIAREFPTLYPAAVPGGFLVVNLNDALGMVAVASQAAQVPNAVPGPNEYWLSTTSNPGQLSALTRALTAGATTLDLSQVLDRRALEVQIASDPIQAGMRGLLTVGALIAAGLAVLGSLIQSAIAARQRAVRFAVLRTIGLTGAQLAGVLLSEQAVVYAFGLVAGTLLGLLLATATLPFLQFSDTATDPARVGVPAYVLAVDPAALLWLYVILLGAFIIALLIAARYAATIGLGKTLRLGED
ncbi:MAG TPA: FtsX-like permease family protein [Ktedonobacterales bacterium]